MRWRNHIPKQVPVLEAVYDCPQQSAPTGYRWFCRWTLAFGDEAPNLAEPVFLLSNARRMDTSPITEGYSALSLNWQYYYHSDYLELSREGVYEPATFLSQRGHHLPTRLNVPMLFRAVFSPNSKWLCGVALAPRLETDEIGDFYCVECASGKILRVFKAPEKLAEFGWYSDNIHLWYTVEGVAHRPQVFKVNTRTGKRTLLKGEAAEAPFREWDLLNPRYRSTPAGGNAALVYSYDNAVRVRVELPEGDEMAAGAAEVYVEPRGGRERRVLRRGEHSWIRIVPQDVSEDGRWVLLVCQRWMGSETGRQGAYSELVAIHAETKHQYVYLNSKSSSFLFADWRFCRRQECRDRTMAGELASRNG